MSARTRILNRSHLASSDSPNPASVSSSNRSSAARVDAGRTRPPCPWARARTSRPCSPTASGAGPATAGSGGRSARRAPSTTTTSRGPNTVSGCRRRQRAGGRFHVPSVACHTRRRMDALNDIEVLVGRAVRTIVQIAGRSPASRRSCWAPRPWLCVASFLLGLAALDGGIRSVWIVLGIVFAGVAIGAAVIARWRVGRVRKDVPAIAGEVRQLISDGESRAADHPELPGRRRRGRTPVGDRGYASPVRPPGRRGHGIEGSAGFSADAITAITRLPRLALAAVGISLVFAFLALVFLLALALVKRSASPPMRPGGRRHRARLAVHARSASRTTANRSVARPFAIEEVRSEPAPRADSSASPSRCPATTATRTARRGRSRTRSSGPRSNGAAPSSPSPAGRGRAASSPPTATPTRCRR